MQHQKPKPGDQKFRTEWKIKLDILPEVKDHSLFKKLRDDMLERVSAQATEILKNPLIAAQLGFIDPVRKKKAVLCRLEREHGRAKLAMAVKLSQSTSHSYRHWLKFDSVEISKELKKYE